MQVEVVYALPGRQELVSVALDEGAVVAEAIQRSGIEALFPDEDLGDCAVGIWGRLVDREAPLADGDRVELYRPLRIDPREERRARALKGRSLVGGVKGPDATPGRGRSR